MPLCPDSLAALRHIVYGEPQRLYSFRLTPGAGATLRGGGGFRGRPAGAGIPDAGILQEPPAARKSCRNKIHFVFLLLIYIETERNVTEFVLGSYRLEVDVEATRAWYGRYGNATGGAAALLPKLCCRSWGPAARSSSVSGTPGA